MIVFTLVSLFVIFSYLCLVLFSYDFRIWQSKSINKFFAYFTKTKETASISIEHQTKSLKKLSLDDFSQKLKHLYSQPRFVLILTVSVVFSPLIVTYFFVIKSDSFLAVKDLQADDYLNENKIISNILAGERLTPPPEQPAYLFEALDAELVTDAHKTAMDLWGDVLDKNYLDQSVNHEESAALSVNDGTNDNNGSSKSLSVAEVIRLDKNKGFSGDMLRSHIKHGHVNIKNANRNWKKMNSGFTQRLLKIFKVMKEKHGYEMILLEGYRSPQRQQRLLGKGKHVTKAGAYRSYHQFGLAADSAFLKNGKIVITEKDPWAMQGYRLYGVEAKKLGLVWGGDWRMADLGHVELRKPGILGKPHMAKRLTSQ